MSASEQKVRDALEPALAPLGLLIEDVTVMPAGKRRLVRVLLDRVIELDAVRDEPLAPVTLDEIADATRVVSDELDATDLMGEQPYQLEVSSCGTDRPLTQPRHFARNVGRLVTVSLEDGSKVAGRIVSADAQHVTVMPEQDGKKAARPATADARELDYTSITSARVQVEFTRGGDADAAGEDV